MRASAWGLLALLFGCDGAFGPKPFCTPLTCDEKERNCGLVDDHCGHQLSCGECAAGQVCGLSRPNLCGTPAACMPTRTCDSVGAKCGTIDDGCGHTIAWPNLCGANGCGPNLQCQICMPATCPPPGVGCGTVFNSCNQPTDCGTCLAPLMCGLQVMNVCSCPNGANCSHGPPTLFLAGVDANRVDLVWADADPSVQGFELQRSVGGGPFVSLGSVGPTHHAFEMVSWLPGMVVRYQVRAQVPSISDWSNTVSAVAPHDGSVWRTLGGDFGHSGFNRFETGHPPGTFAWEHRFDAGTLQPVVVEPPWIYAVVSDPAGSSLRLLHVDAGTELWSEPIPGVAGQPALFDGQVVVGTSIAPMPSEYLAFDSAGMFLWSAQAPTPGAGFLAPISTGEAIIASAGTGNALLAFDAASGHAFFETPTTPPGPWTPTLSAGELFVFTGTDVETFDVATGARTDSMPLPPGSSSFNWVAANANTLAYTAGNQLTVRSAGATVMGGSVVPFAGPVAIDDQNVYATTPNQLAKFDQQTANYHWAWTTDGGIMFPPVVAAGTVYVSTASTVYAIDTTSGVASWTTSPGGWLSIAGGMLFVSCSDRLRAYQLTP